MNNRTRFISTYSKYDSVSEDRYNRDTTKKKMSYLFKCGNISNNDFVCAICGSQPIEKHHENYALWYSFIPLCKRCHGLTRAKHRRKYKKLMTLCQNDVLPQHL